MSGIRTCRIIACSILGAHIFLFRALSPLVGNAILRHENPSAYTTDAIAALLGFIGSSLFLVFDIVGPVAWARQHTTHVEDDDFKILTYIFAILSSPFLFVGSAVVASVASWGILRSSGHALNIALSKAAIAGAVGSSVLLGSLMLSVALLVALFFYVVEHTEFP